MRGGDLRMLVQVPTYIRQGTHAPGQLATEGNYFRLVQKRAKLPGGLTLPKSAPSNPRQATTPPPACDITDTLCAAQT